MTRLDRSKVRWIVSCAMFAILFILPTAYECHVLRSFGIFGSAVLTDSAVLCSWFCTRHASCVAHAHFPLHPSSEAQACSAQLRLNKPFFGIVRLTKHFGLFGRVRG